MEAYWYFLDILASDEQLVAKVDIANSPVSNKPSLNKAKPGFDICLKGQVPNVEQIQKIREIVTLSDIESLFSFKVYPDAAWLQQSLISFLNQDSSLKQFYNPVIHQELVSEVCERIGSSPDILFRLFVLTRVASDVSDRAFFCFWLAIFLSVHTERDYQFSLDLLLVCLFHDLGIFEIDSDLFKAEKTRETLEPDYYQHAIYGADFVKSKGFSKDNVYKAICQHHEFMDGTGYPCHLMGIHLSEMGQLVNMFDSLFIAYRNTFQPIGRGITDLVPIIEMNSVTRFGYSAKSLITLLNTCARKSESSLSIVQIQNLKDYAVQLFLLVDSLINIIQSFTNTVGFRHEDKALSSLQNGFFHIVLTIHKSENINSEYLNSLENMSESDLKANARDIEDLSLMLKEVMFHIIEFKHRLSQYLNKCQNTSIVKEVEETLSQLDHTVLRLNIQHEKK